MIDYTHMVDKPSINEEHYELLLEQSRKRRLTDEEISDVLSHTAYCLLIEAIKEQQEGDN